MSDNARPGSKTVDVDARVGYQLKRAQQALRNAMDHSLREMGITTAQYAALAALEAAGKSKAPLSAAELARRCFVTPQTMNQIVVALEREGLIARQPPAEGGRVIATRHTAKGRAVLKRAHRAVMAVESEMLAGFTSPQQERLASSLSSCADQLGKHR